MGHGTHAGGIKARDKNIAAYGDDFYKRIGSIGGKAGVGTLKGFATNKDLARIVGRKGGAISRRGQKKKPITIHIPVKTQVMVDYQASLTFPDIMYKRIGWLEKLRRKFNER